MKSVRVLAIAPYQGLLETITKMAAKRQDIDVTAYVGDLGAGLDIARQALEKDTYDIILSRGGTADLLAQALDTPTIDIQISLGDILQAIKLAQNYQAKFAIVGFPSITERAHLICNLLGYDISVHTIRDESTVPELIRQLKDEDYKMCIGDTVTTTVARNSGLNAILITSNDESINTAFDQAIKLNESYARLRRRSQMYECAVKNASSIICIYDGAGRLIHSGARDNPDLEALIRHMRDHMPSLFEPGDCHQEQVIDGRLVIVDAKTDRVDGQDIRLLYITTRPIPPAFSEGGLSVLNRSDAMNERFNHYYGFSGIMVDTNQAIEHFGRKQVPIVLIGEQGTGKDSVAAYLYSIGPYRENPFYTIDCGVVSDKHFVSLLNSPDSPLNDVHVTLYFKNILLLSPVRREQLIQTLEYLAGQRRCRIICSFLTHEDDRTNAEAAYIGISARLGAVLLRLPPLRERAEDIPSIATLYLGQLNTLLGKQFTGFAPEALELLTHFDWPYNLDQFHRVLRELASISSDFYISVDDTATILRNERARYTPTAAININLNQSLNDITYDILRLVLEQEGNNQKRAAERLGIGRSTVWRILKSREE